MTSDEPARVFNFPPASLPHAARRRVNRERFCMEGLIVLGILMLVAYAIYKNGKRDGSRTGYGVGRAHGRQR